MAVDQVVCPLGGKYCKRPQSRVRLLEKCTGKQLRRNRSCSLLWERMNHNEKAVHGKVSLLRGFEGHVMLLSVSGGLLIFSPRCAAWMGEGDDGGHG